jgi:hypothetical protein
MDENREFFYKKCLPKATMLGENLPIPSNGGGFFCLGPNLARNRDPGPGITSSTQGILTHPRTYCCSKDHYLKCNIKHIAQGNISEKQQTTNKHMGGPHYL